MRVLTISLAMLIALPASASISVMTADETDLAVRATALVEKVESVEAYLDEREEIMRLARVGDYGRLSRSDMGVLNASMARMNSLLKGRQSALELTSSQRIELYNAQEAFNAIIQNQRENARVCRKVANTGTRIPVTQCFTVAELEKRRIADREFMQNYKQPTCIQGADGVGSC